ncbi:enoyl-CoA hydratase/isomerase family protein [Cryptosporangium minutisporangium]|uniref:Enoyl-CoA hydratase/isomerase family protein n=1 Tax=Cryptosporangium minutisporangium TaxID=113569 RepID=A0ABP6SSM8_9ACTN
MPTTAEVGSVHTEDSGRVRVLTFHRPSRANAFDSALYRSAAEALRAADADPTIGAVVLTGAGRSFTAGTDLAEMVAQVDTDGGDDGGGHHPFTLFLNAVTDCSKPLLAAVNGAAVGLGLTLLAHCDLVLVSENARLRAPFTVMGVVPEAASSYLLPRRMNRQAAIAALLTSDWITATEAVQSGLALRVCPAEDLLPATVELAQRITAHPDASVRATRRLIRESERDEITAALRREGEAFAEILRSPAIGDQIRDHLSEQRRS